MPRFVVQEHDATTRHHDLRLEVRGVFRCWAVPKGPSPDPAVRRLAVWTGERPLAAGDFEGVRPGARRGSGAVIVWDRGAWSPPEPVDDPDDAMAAALERGHATFVLDGEKLRGRFSLIRTAEGWLLVKGRDDEAWPHGAPVPDDWGRSVVSGRTLDQVLDDPGTAE